MADTPKNQPPSPLQTVAKPEAERRLDKAGFAFLPQTWQELWNYAREISQTDFVPNAMRGKPGAVLAAWQTGHEIGLPAMAALQSVAIINGRPSVHSAGYWAIIVSNPMCEWYTEDPPDKAAAQGYGECTIKRRGNPHIFTRRFTMDEAKRANLTNKDNWKLYPGDMLVFRARHRVGTAAIPEACLGVMPSEVAIDLEPAELPMEKRRALSRPQPIQETEHAGDIAETNQASQSVGEESTGTGQSSGETKEPIARDTHLRDGFIESIQAFTAMPETEWLNRAVNEMPTSDDKLAVTTAWNAKKKELGL